MANNKDSWVRLVDNKMKDYGEINYHRKVIRVNKHKSKKLGRGGIIDTIIHEETHRIYPQLGEREIKRLTEIRLRKMDSGIKKMYYNKYRRTK
ncbi:MAG: hypothetical protein WCV92_02460 [Candidatus Buchananbacteria bacterium]|jgi:hypothetical protein